MRPFPLARLATPLLMAGAALALNPVHAQVPAAATPATTATTTPATTSPAALPAREPAPGDLAQQRRLVLPNGLKVLLWSDPKLNVSSAALAVGVGSLADPPQRQGLAHFLEHMLFLGTEKYPDITGFDAYLRRHSGINNAYTAEDRTNYHFEIRHEAFEGALDRFAQFFIAPLFDARFTEREMNAVASEHQKNLENDLWRENQLRAQFSDAGHPARHFGTGSQQTLAGVTRDELLAFYRRHYSANLMTLALTGPASLDQLERWARQFFAAVPDRQAAPLVVPSAYRSTKPALRVLRMQPIKDLRHLHLEFALPALQPGWPHKSAELLGFILGGEGPDSLLARLKAEGLATSLSAGAQAATGQYGAFELQIGLTPQGLAQWQTVLQRVFSLVRALREDGLPAALWQERATLARLDERFRDKGEGAALATSLANLVMDHPLDLAERVPFAWVQPDPQAFRALLDRLSPDNLLVTLVAQGLPVDQTEPIYGTRYSSTEDTGPAYAALAQAPRVAGLGAPRANRFIPGRVTQLPLQPARLIDEPALSLLHAQDSEFQRPQAAYLLRHRLPRSLASPGNAVLLAFYEACVREALNETTYLAAEAGQRFMFAASLDGGVLLAAEGWDEATGRLLDAVTPQLADCGLDEARFAALKDRLLRGLSAAETADAYLSVRETRRSMLREFYTPPDQMLPLARTVTLAQVKAFARQVLVRGRLEALVFGNVGPDQAVATARRVAATLGTQAVPAAELLRPRQWVGTPGQDLRSREQLVVNNSTLRREYLLGDDGPEGRAAAAVIAAVIADPFYSEMRTRQQLGYIVQAAAFEDERQTVALFVIQSGEHTASVLEARADAFIRTLPQQLAAMPAETWAAIVGGVRSRLLERDKSIAERAMRLFNLAYVEHGDWARTDATVQALDALTQARAGDLLARALAPQTRQMRQFLGYARQHALPATEAAGAPATVSDRAGLAAWKKAQRYE